MEAMRPTRENSRRAAAYSGVLPRPPKNAWRLRSACGNLRTGSKPLFMPPSLEQFKCPACGTPFSAADVDNHRDTVICGSCGASTPWPSLVGEPQLRKIPLAPPRHLAVKTVNGKVTLTYRHPIPKILLYAGLAVVWGIITLVLVLLSFGPGKTDFALPVFTTLFAITEVFLIFLCIDMMLGKAVLRVEPGKASLFRGIGPVGSTWTFLLPAQALIMMERKGGDETDYCRISVPQPAGRPFYFSGGISNPETLEYIVSVLRQFRA